MKEFQTIRSLSRNGDGPLSRLSWDEIVNFNLGFGWEPAGPVYTEEWALLGNIKFMPMLREKVTDQAQLDAEEKFWKDKHDEIVKEFYS